MRRPQNVLQKGTAMKKQPAALAAALLLCLPLMGAARTTGSLSSALLS